MGTRLEQKKVLCFVLSKVHRDHRGVIKYKKVTQISTIPSEISRFKFTVSWLCDDRTAADNLRRKGPRHRAMTATSPCCRRITVFKLWRNINCRPLIGSRFVDGDGYRFKESINVSNDPFPIFSAPRFPVWKRRAPLLYIFRLCGSPVSRVH
jgi:hypothetical protein